MAEPWSSLVEGLEGSSGPWGKLFVFYENMQHSHDIILYMFDYYSNPVVHLFLLKSSMAELFAQYWAIYISKNFQI